MKTKPFLIGITTVFFVCISLFLYSCKDSAVNMEKNAEELAYIQFSPKGKEQLQSSRMIFNTPVTEDDINGVILTGVSEEGYNLSREWDSLDEMLCSVIAIKPDKWTFILTLQKDRVDCLGCTIEKTIVAGNQTILFELSEVEDGNGTMSVTLVFPKTIGVSYANAGLYQTGNHDSLAAGFTEVQINAVDSLDTNKSQITYSLSSVASGTYYIKFLFYDENDLYINRYGDYIRFAPACETTKTIALTEKELLKTPAIPTGLYVSSKTASSATIAWNTVNGAESYKVYYGTVNNANSATFFNTVETNSCTITGLSGCTTYYFWVSAYNSISGESQKCTSVIDTTKITEVTGVATSGKTTSSITIKWNEVTGAEGYYVYYNNSEDFDSATKTTSINNTEYTLTGLTSGDTWYFWVSAWESDNGEIAPSTVYSSVVSAAFIAPPTEINITSVSTSSATLSWTAVTGATGYEIYKNNTNNSATAELIKTQTGVSAEIKGLSSGTVYYFWVRSLNSTNDAGDFSEAFTCKTLLAAPQNIFAAAVSTTSVEVTWDSVIGATGYDVYYGTSNSIGTMTKAASTTDTVYTVSALTAGTTYYFRVKATDASTESTASSGMGCIPTEPATGIIIKWKSATEFTVKWDAVVSATKYQVVYGLYDGESLQSVNVNIASADIHNVDDTKNYSLYILSFANNCWSKSKILQTYGGVVQIVEGTYTTTRDGSSDYLPSGTAFSTFSMGKYEVTYSLWYQVRKWGEANGYSFNNKGKEGSNGNTGNAPTSAKYNPVCNLSFYDVIAWCNAYSQMCGFEPVYYSDSELTTPFTSSSGDLEYHTKASSKGFRLPTIKEQEFTARGGDCESATWNDTYAGSSKIDDVCWTFGNSGTYTHNVGLKKPINILIYDLNGNAWEWNEGGQLYGGSACFKYYYANGYESNYTTSSLCGVNSTYYAEYGSVLSRNNTSVYSSYMSYASLNTYTFYDYALGFRVACSQ